MNWTVLWSKLKALEGKVDSLEIISFEKVEELPEEGERNVIYLVPKEVPGVGDYSDEYIWDSENETFEKIGDTQIAPIEDYIKNSSIAPLYDSTSTYAVGDIVAYEKELYRCTTAISTAEEWDSTHWTKTDIISEMPVIPPIPADANHNIASAYDSTATYDLGDLCIYNGNLYECTTAISTAEEWTAAHWTQKTVAQELAGVGENSVSIFEGTASGSSLTLSNGKIFKDIIESYNSNKAVYLKYGNELLPLWELICEKQLSIEKVNMRFVGISDFECVGSGSSSSLSVLSIRLIKTNGFAPVDGNTLKMHIFNTDNSLNYSTKFIPTSTAVKNAIQAIDYAKDTSVTALYDSTATYELGDIVMYNKELYECTTAIPVAEAWDSTHWTKTDIFSQMPTPGGASYVELGGKLLAGDNTLTFNNECITVGSIFEFYTDAYGVNPTDVSVTDGTLVLTFDIQQNNLKVKVRVWEDENPITVIKSVDILTSDTGPVSAAVKFTYKEDNAEISEQTILYSQTDPPINIGDLILVDYGLTYSGHWTIKAVRPCTYNGTVYAVGEIIRHWDFIEEVDFTVVENI